MLWVQVIGLPLALVGLLFAGLAYSHQAADSQQALNAVKIQQHEIVVQQRAIAAQTEQVQATVDSTNIQEKGMNELISVDKQLAALLTKGERTP